jgi:AcrR family transcriptional regulator
VVARAGVSRRTFYELFADREECFLAALNDAIARASLVVGPAYESGGGWAERLRLALSALLWFLDSERDAGRLLVVESLGAGAAVLRRRQRVLTQVIAAVDAGRSERADAGPPPLTAEGVVGGALSIVHARMVAGERDLLLELLNPLMSMFVMPYLGPAASRRELQRPLPKHPALHRQTSRDPLRDVGMRLTYRTVRVLLSVAAAPGSSNREVGVAAGVADQGQISKLLGRLERLGLVQNGGVAPGKGAPNAWTLTAKGVRVRRVVSSDGDPPGVEANPGSM